MTNAQEHLRTVNLCEYEQLRSEINNRTNLAAGLIAIQLAALGAGLSILNDLPDIVVALAIISSLLWLMWIDHASQVYKIAAYISLYLAPRLREGDETVLGWESFMRKFDQGGQQAADALYQGLVSKHIKVLPTSTIGGFISGLFGASAPLLISGFVFSMYEELAKWSSILSLRGVLVILATMVWLYAWSKYRLFVAMRIAIDQAVMEKASRQKQKQNQVVGQPKKKNVNSP